MNNEICQSNIWSNMSLIDSYPVDKFYFSTRFIMDIHLMGNNWPLSSWWHATSRSSGHSHLNRWRTKFTRFNSFSLSRRDSVTTKCTLPIWQRWRLFNVWKLTELHITMINLRFSINVRNRIKLDKGNFCRNLASRMVWSTIEK